MDQLLTSFDKFISDTPTPSEPNNDPSDNSTQHENPEQLPSNNEQSIAPSTKRRRRINPTGKSRRKPSTGNPKGQKSKISRKSNNGRLTKDQLKEFYENKIEKTSMKNKKKLTRKTNKKLKAFLKKALPALATINTDPNIFNK